MVAAEVEAGGTQITVVEQQGECTVLDYVAPNTVMTVSYRVRRCPTEGGFEATLVHSDEMDTFHETWKVVPADDGSHITYNLQTSTSLPIPGFLVNSTTRRRVKGLMKALEAALQKR